VVLSADLSMAAVLDWELCTTGDPIADFAFYEAFSWWKQACIVEGVYAGREGGMRHQRPVSDIADRVDAMLDHARTPARALD
jgi:aminoglycoside phosphotransferase (APT) family kinase protein